MHPRTREVLDHLDHQRAALEQALTEIPPALGERRPGPDRWSIAEILEHLAVVEARVARVFDENTDAEHLRQLGPEQETGSVLPTFDVARLLDRSQRLTASEASQPRDGLSAAEAWNALTERRRSLRARVLAADGKALGSVRVAHPRLGALDLYQWLIFLGAHEARHTAQIREVAATLHSVQPRA